MCLYSQASSGVTLADLQVLLKAYDKELVRQVVDVSALANALGNRGCEITPTFFDHFLLRTVDALHVLHDWVPQGQLQITQQGQDAIKFSPSGPILAERKISPKSHSSRYCMAMEHAGWQLVPRAPCMTKGMWTALVRFPKVSVFRYHVAGKYPRQLTINYCLTIK